MSGSVVLTGARTPIGKLSGALSPRSATELGGVAIAEALSRSGFSVEDVDYVVMGQVYQAGQGGNAARQAAVLAGLPMSIPASTINKMCLSGLNAIHLADLMIRAGEAEVVIAGGMESMTRAPYLLEGARGGYRYGDQVLYDVLMKDGLTCAFEHLPMGAATEAHAGTSISREDLDSFAASSHERAAEAVKSGRLAAEIAPVSIPQRRGDPIVIDTDEGIRAGTTVESLSKLPAAFSENGTITAGNSSQISDGAAAVIVTSKARAEQAGITPLGEIVGYGQVAGPDASLLTQPSRAALDALERAGLSLGDVSLLEINEAFASVADRVEFRDLGIDDSAVNVNGGAIALGHPVGMSGARLVLTLGHELSRRGGLGVATMCGGGGQGDALLLRALS